MENRCIVCGEIIPEGRQVCPMCEKGLKPKPDDGRERDQDEEVSSTKWPYKRGG